MNSFESWDSKREETDSFKRRMESLHDPTSTNLYMEGYVRLMPPTFVLLISCLSLPLSIDEPVSSCSSGGKL